MKNEYYILCKYLSVGVAGGDKKLKQIYVLEFGSTYLKDNIFTYIDLYFRDTTYFIFKRDDLLRKKLVFLCAMLEVSSYAEFLIPSRKRKTLIGSSISLSLNVISKVQIFIYKLLNL